MKEWKYVDQFGISHTYQEWRKIATEKWCSMEFVEGDYNHIILEHLDTEEKLYELRRVV